MTIQETVGPRFDGASCRGARALLGISQTELATAAGCGRKLVNDFENGGVVPKATKVAAMREALEEAGAVFVRIDDMLMIGVRPGQGAPRSARARVFEERPGNSTETPEDDREG
ncbi:XRE family transcriptional regulator [Aureimonas flava]|uniref:XRE family transcriptional regulator n=2 Tax=Aureimonas flava TaxID=2320271 RepID=A0A3A1WMG3_9HYPH|nr:XRE family transcriptional regulator [Aureimonas flava]